ncbi:TlpA family protein disulfide reductase [Dactylosporangium sp. NPDC051541]|uniref:TlpA family protein disulfide reductase n=1 Tax=Dactylosporangium sp. NPDC051541 TaxID=3363977 RepID=UPI0037AFF7F7
MTTALLVAVMLLAALTLFNLIVVLGVVRRVRSYETRLGGVAEAAPVLSTPVGARVAEFVTSTVDDRKVSRDTLSGTTLFGFFSPDCSACHERLGDFKATAARFPGDAYAVVIRDGGDLEPVLRGLGGTPVVLEDPEGPLSQAFGVRGFPAFVMVREEGVVESTGYLVPALT